MKDKTVIITGAASGIGKATAALFAKQGANVVVSDIQESEGNIVVQEIISAGGKASFFKTDVSKPEEMEALVNFAVKTYGKLDIAVNNAGIGGEINPTADLSIEGWHKVISINLNSLFYGLKYQIQAMLKNGSGSIVNICNWLASGDPILWDTAR
jgi:NAD(P)-dependent dehydrogenase (short-subunit alcohol dehydrogenase family)